MITGFPAAMAWSEVVWPAPWSEGRTGIATTSAAKNSPRNASIWMSSSTTSPCRGTTPCSRARRPMTRVSTGSPAVARSSVSKARDGSRPGATTVKDAPLSPRGDRPHQSLSIPSGRSDTVASGTQLRQRCASSGVKTQIACAWRASARYRRASPGRTRSLSNRSWSPTLIYTTRLGSLWRARRASRGRAMLSRVAITHAWGLPRSERRTASA
jgi:hypothetical protein